LRTLVLLLFCWTCFAPQSLDAGNGTVDDAGQFGGKMRAPLSSTGTVLSLGSGTMFKGYPPRAVLG
jgi:hypothetical protein